MDSGVLALRAYHLVTGGYPGCNLRAALADFRGYGDSAIQARRSRLLILTARLVRAVSSTKEKPSTAEARGHTEEHCNNDYGKDRVFLCKPGLPQEPHHA